MNDDSSVSDAHSLTIAVADGTVTAEAAYCGLSPAEVHSLADHHPTLDVLVRLRSADADGRTVVKGYAILERSPVSLVTRDPLSSPPKIDQVVNDELKDLVELFDVRRFVKDLVA